VLVDFVSQRVCKNRLQEEFQISELQDTLKVPQSLKVYADFERKSPLKIKG